MSTSALPHPSSPARLDSGLLVQRVVTAVLVLAPIIALTLTLPLLWGHAVHLRDVVLAVALYVITGHGVTVGYHRLFTHRSFKANRFLKIALGVAGSMAVQGSLISWVANHRRHHMFSDQPGDPHSPHLNGTGAGAQAKGFVHAHLGWLFGKDTTSAPRFAPDLLADRDLVVVSRLFPLWALASLGVPFAIGWWLSGTLAGAVTAFVWAGVVRMALLHHVTWSVNSVCHIYGRRPFRATDESRNFAPLAVLSFGESWHNFHHASPSSARHGVLTGQLDSTARLIRIFEGVGWATKVRWPSPNRLAAVRQV